jgi:hypothetical protein
MASLGKLSVPVDVTEYLDLDAMVRASDNWAVKQEFCFRITKREASVAIFFCAEAEELGCCWIKNMILEKTKVRLGNDS